jgi:glycosyltransferase involved in cell wall biosynthesis
MKIAIIGTRGIPNNYGGFEQITAHLSVGLSELGHDVSVYNTHHHPYQEKEYRGVKIINCYDPASLGTAGQFIYDLNCIRHARKQRFDILLFMGYTSSSVWGPLFPKQSIIVTNMDGLEWKRDKYPGPVKKFLKWAERSAIRHSEFHIADSPAIKAYLDKEYGIESRYIPYGAAAYGAADETLLKQFGVLPYGYLLLMARMEPENNIETILEGFHRSGSNKQFIVIGNTGNSYGKKMLHRFGGDERIRFAGGVFDQDKVQALRQHCHLYFHGHSVGGTNPSLLEAMSGRTLIAAHRNAFNEAVLGSDGFYFTDADDVRWLAENVKRTDAEEAMMERNRQKINGQFNWPVVIRQYEEFLYECLNTVKHGEVILQG